MFAAATFLTLAALATAQDVLFTATNFEATVYYDLDTSTDVCSQEKGGPFPANWAVTSGINGGVTYCQGSDSTAWTLDNLNSNRIVAMNASMVQGDPSKWCGKEVQIFGPDGNEITIDEGPFVLFDACAACMSNGIVDMSAKGFAAVKGGTCSGNNPTGLTVKVLDTNVSPPGFVSGNGGGNGGSAPAAAPSAAASSAAASSAAAAPSAAGVLAAAPPASSAAASSAAASAPTSATSVSATPSELPHGTIDAAPVAATPATATSAAIPEASKDAQVEAGVSCEFGKWSCDCNQIQVCNYGPNSVLGWETVGVCDNECQVSEAGSITCV